MSHDIPDGHAGDSPASIAARYEILRAAALGAALPVEARSGLGLFLRRGMWGWVRGSALSGEPAPPMRPAGARVTASRELRAVVPIFAAMVRDTVHRRVP